MGYPTTTTPLDTIRQHWDISTKGRRQDLYALALVDVEFTGSSVSAGPVIGAEGMADPSKDDWVGEFVFDMIKQMDMEEPGAVDIRPAQDGGQFVEHQGNLYKIISLAGTTGLRPNQRTGTQVIPFLGGPNPFSGVIRNPETNLPVGEVSGFEAHIRLRNLIRQYWDLKRDPRQANKWELVWQNGKEGEFYIVEPMIMKTRRVSANPLTSSYELQLRTIYKWEVLCWNRSRKDTQRNRTTMQRLNERLTKWSRELAVALNNVEILADRVVTVGQATLNNVIAPARALFDGLTGIALAANRTLSIPRNTVSALALSSRALMEALQGSQYELNAYRQQGLATQLSYAFHGYKDIFRLATKILQEEALFNPTLSSVYTARQKAYVNPDTGLAPITGGSPTTLENIAPPIGTGIATVGSSDTIFTLASRLLGDAARWKELVILNDLKAPYLDLNGDGVDVLSPDDVILYPTAGSGERNSTAVTTNSNDSPIVRRLGRDVKLVSMGDGTFDWAISNTGDAATLEGVPCLEQDVQIKFSTEQGTLATHPFFGVALPIGSQATVRSMVAFRLGLRASLLADGRIDAVNRVTHRAVGNSIEIGASLVVAEVDDAVSISFATRR